MASRDARWRHRDRRAELGLARTWCTVCAADTRVGVLFPPCTCALQPAAWSAGASRRTLLYLDRYSVSEGLNVMSQ